MRINGVELHVDPPVGGGELDAARAHGRAGAGRADSGVAP